MALTIQQPCQVDSFGNIVISGRSGIYFPIQFTPGGVPTDVSASLLYFEVYLSPPTEGLRIALLSAPAQALVTGSITDVTLSTTAIAFGALAAGQVVTGTGVQPGTVITGPSTESNGWIVSISQTVALTALTGTDPSIRVLQMDDAQVETLPLSLPLVANTAPFALRDETGVVAVTPWEATITTTGFNAQPSPGPA